MKKVIFLDDLKVSDIKPEIAYGEYKHLLSEDIKNFFSDRSSFIEINCPGCSKKNSEYLFNKMEFKYRLCHHCRSIYVSPRPTAEELRGFRKHSKSALFFRNTYMKNTLESRSKNVFSFRIQWVMELAAEYLSGEKVLLDYATKYPTLLQQLNNTGLFKCMTSFLPECFEQENLLPANVKIGSDFDEVENSIDLFLAFEAIERIFDPMNFFKDAYKACKKNGLLLLTSTTASGFEYQVLGEHSPNIIFPDRINILSLEALSNQIENAGFKIIEISTPGRLDVEIVKKTYDENPDIPLHDFWKYIFRNRDKSVLHSFQKFLQQSQLSSHVRIAAIKK